MALVTGLFAFNMLGLLTVSLPNRIANWAANKGDNSYAGHFVQGMFATLLATPCSAPFLATAMLMHLVRIC
ncbi:membrane protein suppressor for copper-sensitivity ScsB [Vibrio astriarenae]|nr:membrane protein suppressor for copper-sensitivity ScsB [Vibrio sp. C7]